MAEFDFAAFSTDFAARLKQLGYSLSDAERKWPHTDRAMLSRATNAKTLSAGNVLLLCEMAGIDAYLYVRRGKGRRVTMKSVKKQAVTRGVTRETPAVKQGDACERQ